MSTMLFNPFTGKPRHPSDIASDPKGILVWDGEEPLRPAAPVADDVARDAIQWPKARDVARLDDMSTDNHLRVCFDSDNDVCVEVFDGSRFASVEFCNGGGGGGQSMHTRRALVALMCAIERDNIERPARAAMATDAKAGE